METLEGRVLLSRSAGRVPAVDIQFELAQRYVSPQSGPVDLTVTRSPERAGGALTFKVETSALLDVPRVPGAIKRPPYGPQTLGPIASVSNGPGVSVVSWVMRTTGPNRSELPVVPIDGTYRFTPGQTSVTIPLRLNPSFVPLGDIGMDVVAYLPRSHGYTWWGAKHLTIVPRPDRIPPEVVSSSRSPQGITLTFSKAMDPAGVEDVNNYSVNGNPNATPMPPPAAGPIPLHGDPATGSPSTTDGGSSSAQPLALKSAVYDPTTRTVTLTPTDPLAVLGGYIVLVRSEHSAWQPSPTDTRPLTDLQGNALRYQPDGTAFGA